MTPERPPLIPRFAGREHEDQTVAERRQWIRERVGVALPHLAGAPTPATAMVGNIENPIGVAQVPVGLSGPLHVRGSGWEDVLYVPLATTEGALVRSIERGAIAITRAGGASSRVVKDTNQVTPSFSCGDLDRAIALAEWLETMPPELVAAAESTTRHGRLVSILPRVLGATVLATFRYSTADASGMNMVVRATDAACRKIVELGRAEAFLVFSGASGEKRPAGALLAGGKGKSVTAEVVLPRTVLRAVLGTDAARMLALWSRTTVGQISSGTLGVNGHVANALAALLIACGQDVANVANAAVAMTVFEPAGEDGLRASVSLPSLTVGTVGGGTGVGTAAECLALLDCRGADRARRFAEIVAATVLAGELSFAAAIAAGDMAEAHERYGRNRPAGP